jgi:deoxyribodipyrimidine photo-lyase
LRLVWHRGDLRTHDHAALTAALAAGPAVGVVVLDPAILGSTTPRRRALFHRNVRALRRSYQDRGGLLVVRHGEPAEELVSLADALQDVERIHALASFTPYGVHRDQVAADALAEVGLGIRWHDGLFVHSPGTVRTSQDDFYSVFSPFFRRWRSMGTPDPLPSPDRIPAPDLDAGFDPGDIADYHTDVELPEPGEDAALEALEEFVTEGLVGYGKRRDRLDGAGTSRLSVYLTLGVLSARTAVARAEAEGPGAQKWISEVAWRDYLADLLYHRPDLLEEPFQPRWKALEWPGSDAAFDAWRDGKTGIPAVDAAMRQLRETGWISNRARMIAAQFLSKNLQVDWRRGEAVFKGWLLDGDTGSNVGNWQWAAGLGVDNAPYFRVMNPVTQANKHDPDGEWLRRWVPESDGDPAPRDPVADPKSSRAAYIGAAEAVPAAADADPPPDPRRPALALATDAQLMTVEGIGPATASEMLDRMPPAAQHWDEVPGIGPALTDALRRRFAT